MASKVDKQKIERIMKERDTNDIVSDLLTQITELQMQVDDLETRVTNLEGGA
jgi:uncharacterized protein involved in exopolysaccharide biosynthesis